MKYYLPWIGIFVSIFMISCASNTNTNEKNKSVTQTKNEEELEGTVTQKDTDYKSVVFIDEEDARSLSKSFNRVIRSRILGNDDRTSAVWFDSSVVRLLYEALYTGPSKGRLDGLRIYFGRYPKGYVDKKREKKLTMFLLLTVPGKYPKTHNDTFYFPKPSKWDTANKEHILNLNHGELCPEVCDSTYSLRNEY